MTDQCDTILIIDDDPEARALLREQVFAGSDFRVVEAKNGADGLLRLKEHAPDLIVVDSQLPDLAGKDLLVAFKSQGYRGPLIVIAPSGSERLVLEVFRLGATDYITRPIREAEALAAVERGLHEVRLRRQRDTLTAQLRASNDQLEARVNELTTLYAIGQSVTAMRDLEQLINRVLEGALSVTGADHAKLILRDDDSGQLILRAGKNMQLSMVDRLGGPVQDPLAELVMTSHEALTVSGEGLRRFSMVKDLYAVAYAPLTVKDLAIGALAVGNHQTQAAFSENHGRLLKALADYAAIAIVNARLFNMLEQRARGMEAAYRELQTRDGERRHQLKTMLERLTQPLNGVETELIQLAQGSEGRMAVRVQERLTTLSQQVKRLIVQINRLAQQQGD